MVLRILPKYAQSQRDRFQRKWCWAGIDYLTFRRFDLLLPVVKSSVEKKTVRAFA
jgi:hypothetical protein